MRKVTSWLLILAVLASLLCVPTYAAESPAYATGSVSVDSNGRYLTLTLSAAETTHNGRLSVSYNSNRLTLLSIEVAGQVQDIAEETGKVTFGYADLDAIEAGETIATLSFQRTPVYFNASLTVSVLDFNGQEGKDAALDVFDVKVPALSSTGNAGFGGTGGTGSTGSTGSTVVGGGLPFLDVNKGDWFYDAVDYVVENGYFNGTSAKYFSPNGTMTRAMFVTVLGRMAGADVDHNTNAGFTDVVPGEFYAGYVKWANENGIVLGTSASTFSPNASVTREQMAAFLYRYAKFMDLDVTASDRTMKSFPDAAAVSDWAVDAMAWATDNGVINGTSKGLEPQASTTRAQVAQIVLNFETMG